MTVKITLNKAKVKHGEDLIIVVKREDQSDNQFSLTIHDQEGDSIYALGISGSKQTDTIVIPNEDIINWEKGEYSIRIFGVKNSLSFELVD
tara:strand:- start:1306 stop:1578 length:273 start_codon:yes stop_codon:yes gene_type:complete